MQALAPEHVVYAGTASKSWRPGLRLGWLVLPAPADGRRGRGQAARRPARRRLEQLALAELIASGAYDRHVRRARLRYRRRRDRLASAPAATRRRWGSPASPRACTRCSSCRGQSEAASWPARPPGPGSGGAGRPRGRPGRPALVVGYGTRPSTPSRPRWRGWPRRWPSPAARQGDGGDQRGRAEPRRRERRWRRTPPPRPAGRGPGRGGERRRARPTRPWKPGSRAASPAEDDGEQRGRGAPATRWTVSMGWWPGHGRALTRLNAAAMAGVMVAPRPAPTRNRAPGQLPVGGGAVSWVYTAGPARASKRCRRGPPGGRRPGRSARRLQAWPGPRRGLAGRAAARLQGGAAADDLRSTAAAAGPRRTGRRPSMKLAAAEAANPRRRQQSQVDQRFGTRGACRKNDATRPSPAVIGRE